MLAPPVRQANTKAAPDPPAPRRAPALMSGNQAMLRRASGPPLQAKLQVGAVNDPLEREADQVAETVMRMPAVADQAAPRPPGQAQGPHADDATQLRCRSEGDVAPAATAPAIVDEVVAQPGRQLDGGTRAFFEPRLGVDLGHVRLHDDARAMQSANAVQARAYTVGNHIAFAGNVDTGSDSGRRLMAHELAHVLQQGGEDAHRLAEPAVPTARQVQRDASAVDLDKEYRTALQMPDWAAAAHWLNGFSPFDIQTRLAELTPGQIAELHKGALADIGPDSNVARMTEPGTPPASLPPPSSSVAPPAPAPAPAPAADTPPPVAALGAGQKLSRALDYARSERDAAWNQQIAGLKSPQSILAMVAIAAAFIAAQTVPVTWIADAALLAGLTIAGYFMGVSAATFVIDIGKFFNAINAQSESDLEAAGKALAEAVSIFGIFAISGALSHGIGSGLAGPKTPLGGMPPVEYADAYAPGGGIVRVPVEMIPENAPTIPSEMQSRGGGKPAVKPVDPAKPAPADPAPVPEAKAAPGNEAPPTDLGIPGYRTEPTLKNAGYGPRPDGGAAGADYARKITGSDESLYVSGLKQELGGTGYVELDGYRPASKTLLDAKDAGPKTFYDVSGAYKTPPDSFTVNFKVPSILNEAMRQGHALLKSGASDIEWHVSNEVAAGSIRQLFAEHGINIKVIYTPK